MQARTSPTSPAAKKNAEAVTKVWTDGQLQQPPKTPWGRLVLLVVFLTLVLNVATVAAFGWYVHRYPQTWLSRFAPLTTTTTTVVQPTKEITASIVPAAIERLLESAHSLARNQGQSGVYRDSDALGLAWPLSSSGWTVSVEGAWPADVKTLTLIPAVGQAQAITSTVTDPGTQFVFLKSTELTASPVSLGSVDDLMVGTSVWVIDGQSAINRKIIRQVEPRWASSDLDEEYYQLDLSLNLPIGSAVVTTDGRLIGLVGQNDKIWPLPSVASAVKQVIQQASLSRPVLGIRTLNRATARVVGEPTASGWLIGADSGEPAVVAKGPADVAGLKDGDIITAIDDLAPTPDIFSVLGAYKAGDKIKITYQRKNQEKNATATLGSTRP